LLIEECRERIGFSFRKTIELDGAMSNGTFLFAMVRGVYCYFDHKTIFTVTKVTTTTAVSLLIEEDQPCNRALPHLSGTATSDPFSEKLFLNKHGSNIVVIANHIHSLSFSVFTPNPGQ
jgi:hypothetical protein